MKKRKSRIVKGVLICGALAVLAALVFLGSLRYSHKYYRETGGDKQAVSLRRLPYPYKSAVALCSDIDGTESLEEFLTIQEFLTTGNRTEMGVGLGLEIGNSFFPLKTRESPFALDLDNPRDRGVIVDLIKLGYIDTIHSFVGADRREIEKITEFLSRNDCRLEVWVNHANDRTDLGSYPYAYGDDPGSNHYHADFSLKALGYRFVWVGDVSSIVGQGIPLNLQSFFSALDKRHFAKSLVNNVFKEIFKYSASFFGKKYVNRKHNDLIYPLRLDDGQEVFGFVRSNVFYQGSGEGGAILDSLDEVLREDIFEKLNANGGYMILYTHFGVNRGYPYVSADALKALRRLERESSSGNTYVTTTERLLAYYVNRKYLTWSSWREAGQVRISITSISDPVRGTFIPTVDDLRGVTFYTEDPARTRVYIGEEEILGAVRNAEDDRGQKSIMIPLKPLPRLDNLMKEYRERGYFGALSEAGNR